MRILIIDGDESSRTAFHRAICEFCDCDVESFSSPLDAVSRCETIEFAVVLVDYGMPAYDGIEVIQRLRGQKAHEAAPVIMVTSNNDRSIRLAALKAGATDFLNKPLDRYELRARISNFLGLRKAQNALAERARVLELEHELAIEKAKRREKETIWCLAQAMASRDGNTGDHVERVANIAELIAAGLGLPADVRRNIHTAAPLHDIGKIGIPDVILQKPGMLNPAETVVMRQHVEIGVGILRKSSTTLAHIAMRIIAGHHERWDGAGYPLGLHGTEIPIEARVVAVADVFDALCSERPYKAAWSPDQAYREIVACAGSQFDPACVAAFKLKWPEIRRLVDQADVPTGEVTNLVDLSVDSDRTGRLRIANSGSLTCSAPS